MSDGPASLNRGTLREEAIKLQCCKLALGSLIQPNAVLNGSLTFAPTQEGKKRRGPLGRALHHVKKALA